MARRIRTLEDVYARIPAIRCRGECQDSCGPIAMSNEEDRRLQARGIDVPSMVDAVAAVERGEDYYCPALVDGQCSVYEVRPTVCRLWGATTSMPCPHGCTPLGALSQEDSHQLLRVAGEVGGGMAERFFRPDEQEAGPSPAAGDGPGPDGG